MKKLTPEEYDRMCKDGTYNGEPVESPQEAFIREVHDSPSGQAFLKSLRSKDAKEILQ